MKHDAIEVTGLNKTFGSQKALSDVNLTVGQGEFVALIGSSGSGKSTLLRHTSGLVRSDRDGGRIAVLGRTVQESGRINGRIRELRADIGFIFQQFNLVGRLTLLQNVMTGGLARIPAWRSLSGFYTREEKKAALHSLYRVGLHEQVMQRASTLSGGQQQRAAVARTMQQQARIILADEPIASLDPESARLVMDSLARLNRENGITIVVSLHQVETALKYCPRSIALKNGRVMFDGPSARLDAEALKRIYGTGLKTVAGEGPARRPQEQGGAAPKAHRPGEVTLPGDLARINV